MTEAQGVLQEDAKRLFAVCESWSEESAMLALNDNLEGVGARRKTQVLFVATRRRHNKCHLTTITRPSRSGYRGTRLSPHK